MSCARPGLTVCGLLLMLCWSAVPCSAVAPLSGPVDMVILTDETLAPSFADYATGRSSTGVSTQVVTLAEIEQTDPSGRDLPERMRSWLTAAHEENGLQFVLLGGSADVVPTRYARSRFYPVGGSTDIATDLYYGCLDGNWDADGDDVFGEAYRDFIDTGDEVDLVAELVVGRVPVDSPSQAEQWSTKALSQFRGYIGTEAVWASEVLFPYDWSQGDPITLDGAAISEDWLMSMLALDNTVHHTLLYQNVDAHFLAQPLSGPSVVEALQTNEGAIFTYVGVGDSVSLRCGGEALTADNLAGLSNAPHFFLANLMSNKSATFDEPSVGRVLVSDGDGGAVAVTGFSQLVFPTTASGFFTDFFATLLGQGPESVAVALESVRSARAGGASIDSATRWLLMSWVFLGDPSAGLPVEAVMSTVTSSPFAPGGSTLHPIVPNPFNPHTAVAFTLPAPGRVRLRVHDLRGRHVRTLVHRFVEAGRHEVVFDGRDEDGASLATGVYLIRLDTIDGARTRKLTLLR